MKTVLLAEDNDELRCTMEWVLGGMGYRVVSCADAQTASSAFRSHDQIDALLTDFQMPGRSGMDLACELTALRPTLPVIILTGSILPVTIMQKIRDRCWWYMSKPCHLPSLEITLTKLVGPQPPDG